MWSRCQLYQLLCSTQLYLPLWLPAHQPRCHSQPFKPMPRSVTRVCLHVKVCVYMCGVSLYVYPLLYVCISQCLFLPVDIDECANTPGLCGLHSVCTNAPGTFHCSCVEGYFSSTGVLWETDVTVCESESYLYCLEIYYVQKKSSVVKCFGGLMGT